MAETDIQQSENTLQITGQLGDFVEFKNGRSSPDRTDFGTFAVYGSNGEIGKADVTNAPEGTLVVGRVGSYCGSVHYSPDKCWVTDNAIIGSSRSQKDSRFWFYKLASLDLNNYRAGSGQPLLNQQILNSIQVSIPASEDDRFQIASVLAAFDDKIDLNRCINKTLEAMAQAIFKSWFVDIDPVKAKIAALADSRDPLRAAMSAISGKLDAELDTLPPEQYEQLAATAALFPDEMEESELGEIPRGWVVEPIGNLVECLGGATPDTKNPDFWEPGEYAWTTPKDLSGAHSPVLLGTERKLSKKGLGKISSGLLPVGTLLMSSRAPIGYLSIAKIPVAINQGYIAMPPGGTLSPLYLYFWCKENLESIKSNANGSTFLEISKKAFRPLLALKPSNDLLGEFLKRVEPLFNRIVVGEKEKIELTNLRDTLLPKLLSGELSVTEAMAEAEA